MSADKIEKYLKLVVEMRKRSSNPIVANALHAYRTVPDVAMSGFYELVTNVPGTSDEKAPGGSWKSYWIHNGLASGPEMNQWPSRCSVCDCTNTAAHGAHVRDADGHVVIVPLCAEHNNPNNRTKMLLRIGTVMVDAPKGGCA